MPTTALLLTPRRPAAIAVILLAGDHALEILQRLAANPRVPRLLPGQVARSNLIHPTSADILDDALIVHTAPYHYEIHLHGGPAVVDSVLAALALFVPILTQLPPSLFGNTLNTEIAATLPQTLTLTAARLIAHQSTAGLTAFAEHWLPLSDNLPALSAAAQTLLARSLTLALLLPPIRIALIGAPNAGKSTLANALLGRPASITSPAPGTTRDWVEAGLTLENSAHVAIAATLIDTAGIRDTADPLEAAAIERTHQQVLAADLILHITDGTHAATPLPLKSNTRPTLLVRNKADAPHWQSGPGLPVSAVQKVGFQPLFDAILTALDLARVHETEPFAFTPRQRAILQNLTTAHHPAHSRQHLLELVEK